MPILNIASSGPLYKLKFHFNPQGTASSSLPTHRRESESCPFLGRALSGDQHHVPSTSPCLIGLSDRRGGAGEQNSVVMQEVWPLVRQVQATFNIDTEVTAAVTFR